MDMREEALDRLLFRLEPDLPSSEKRYRQLRLKLTKFFAWRRSEDPDSLADETISRLVKKIRMGEEIRANNPYSYVYAIAVNVFREYLREKRKNQEVLDNLPPPLPPSEELLDCRKQCLQTLPLDRLLFLQRYYLSDESREELARSHGMTLNALRLQVHRIKHKLKACHEDCLKQ
jgi:DNA-directed RNA polymerase specialized sigma24 family protein